MALCQIVIKSVMATTTMAFLANRFAEARMSPRIATRFAGIVPTAIPTSPPGAEEVGPVTRIVDGDTIDVLLNGVIHEFVTCK